MAEVIEKRSFGIEPTKFDKELVRGIGRLFPYFETEPPSLPVRIRRWALSAIAAVALAIVAGIILRLL